MIFNSTSFTNYDIKISSRLDGEQQRSTIIVDRIKNVVHFSLLNNSCAFVWFSPVSFQKQYICWILNHLKMSTISKDFPELSNCTVVQSCCRKYNEIRHIYVCRATRLSSFAPSYEYRENGIKYSHENISKPI